MADENIHMLLILNSMLVHQWSQYYLGIIFCEWYAVCDTASNWWSSIQYYTKEGEIPKCHIQQL